MQGRANGQEATDNGAAINMHLAASLFILHQRRSAGHSAPAPPADSPPRNPFSPPSAGWPSDFSQSPKQGNKEDAAGGTIAMRQHQVPLACVVDEAARASVIATELSNAPMVNLVAGVLDAEATRLREEGMGDIVKTKLK